MPNKLQTKKPRAAKLLGNTSYRLQNRRFMSTELWNTRVQKIQQFLLAAVKVLCVFSVFVMCMFENKIITTACGNNRILKIKKTKQRLC